jgi:hypothetical protein
MQGVVSQFFKFLAVVALVATGPAMADQVRQVDPNLPASASPSLPTDTAGSSISTDAGIGPMDTAAEATLDTSAGSGSGSAVTAGSGIAAPTTTYKKDDVIGAAEGVFGKGAQGLAELIEKILKDQGEPNAYIAGREVSGAVVVGLRYGSGTLSHGVEGQRPVYWTGPSVGFDLGGDVAKTFVLVYNLYDSQDLYKRYPQVEGRAYFVGGFAATYLRRGNVAIIPVHLGVGVRLGANVGYMKFSEKSKWFPF